MTSDQLPTIIPPGSLAGPADGQLVPALIADAGDAAGWRYVEFFTANIPQPAYAARLCPGLQRLLRLVREPRR
jgi:hypothetical protein